MIVFRTEQVDDPDDVRNRLRNAGSAPLLCTTQRDDSGDGNGEAADRSDAAAARARMLAFNANAASRPFAE